MLVETQFKLKEWFIGRNRYSRLEWWIYFSLQFVYPIACILLFGMMSPIIRYFNKIFPIFPLSLLSLLILYFVLEWKCFMVTIGRLHDTNRSGWNILWLIIPGGIFYIIAVCGFLEGTDEPNKYGNPPPVYEV